jgi:hypothetical protein
MASALQGWTDDDGRLAEAGGWPVLVRLPNVPVEAHTARAVKPAVAGGNEYRFDPPQSTDRASQTAQGAARTRQEAAALHSPQQPHLFNRRRNIGQRGFPRRHSPVLPSTNPFSNPRPRLLDSVAPAVRFLTMVALFTAAGLWVQMLGRQSSPPSRFIETPKTAAQSRAVPAKSAADDTVPGPTATGPIETAPESGARVGQIDRHDFAIRENSAAGPLPTARPAVAPPHFLISPGSSVPRVRITDSSVDDSSHGAMSDPNASTSRSPNSEGDSEESASVARFPGFFMQNSTR